jgi:mannosylglycerate hydrolase
VNENGTLQIFDKQLKQSFDQVFLLENGGDDGDEYDFSPLSEETLIYSQDVKAQTTIKQNTLATTLEIYFQLAMPSDLEKRKAKIIDSFVDVKLVVTIPNHQPRIEVEIAIDNKAKDHRLRLLVPTGIASKCSISDNQFGYIKRDVYDLAMDVWEEEGWDERPDSIYPMLSFVGLSNEDYGVAIATDSTREFEIIGERDDTIAITLFRSVGFLGKEEMLRRPGRPSGIKMPTPDSQMIGKIKLALGLFLHAGSTLKANVGRLAKEYTTPITFYNKIPYNAMKLNGSGISIPIKFSLLHEHIGGAVLSTLKKAELSDDYIIRYFNPTAKKCVVEIDGNVEAACFVNLNEEWIGDVVNESGKIRIELLPNQVKTLALKR